MEQTAYKRVEKFLDERAKIKRLDPVIITGLHSGDEHKEADLTVSDLRGILRDNAKLREAALAVIMPLIKDTAIHPCDEMDIDKKAKACPYNVDALYRLCLPNVQAQR